MTSFTLEQKFSSRAEGSAKVAEVAGMFGLGVSGDRPVTVLEATEVRIEPGQVVYVTGGSGAGKSVLVRLIKEQLAGVVDLDAQVLPSDRCVVDCFEAQLPETLQWLSTAGLSDAFAILRRPNELSDGQRYRLRLALALAQRPAAICIDEFCATLDRITAAVIAHNVRKFADKYGTTFVVATSHDDILEDLSPDVVIVKHLGSQCDIYYPGRGVRPFN